MGVPRVIRMTNQMWQEVAALGKAEHRSVSTMARVLLREALDRRAAIRKRDR